MQVRIPSISAVTGGPGKRVLESNAERIEDHSMRLNTPTLGGILYRRLSNSVGIDRSLPWCPMKKTRIDYRSNSSYVPGLLVAGF